MMLLIVFCGIMLITNNVEGDRTNELEIIVESKPDNCNRKAHVGDVVSVHYTGKLENGRVFDTSLAEGREPLQFRLGEHRVIKGWEEGINGMCVGEKRRLIIPPHLAYGKQGVNNVIPPDSYLIFTTELVEIKSKPFLDISSLLQVLTWPALGAILLYVLYKRFKEQSQAGVKEPKGHKKSKRK